MRSTTNRNPRFESLENRRLLSVTAGSVETWNPAPTAADEEPTTWLVSTLSDGAGDHEGLLSLREAIASAKSGDRIRFAPALSGQTIILTGKQLELSVNVTIDASDLQKGVTIDGGAGSRVFSVTGGADVKMVNLRICGGTTTASGGGIHNSGVLNLTGCAVVDNSAARGGGIENVGELTLINCTVAGNRAKTTGGGLDLSGGSVSVENSIVAGNSAEGGGDNIHKSDAAAVSASYVLSPFTDWTESDHLVEYDAQKEIFSDAANGVYTLASGSQGIDAGNNALAATARDLTGATRIQHLVIDLGAYESGIGAGTRLSGWHVLYDGEEHQPEIDGLEEGDFVEFSTDGGARFVTVPPIFTEMGAYPLTVRITRPEYDAYTESGEFQVRETPSSIVTSLEDLVDPVDGQVTLREAIGYTPAGGTVLFVRALAGKTLVLSGEDLRIADSLEIDASDLQGGLMIDAAGKSRVFFITGGTAAKPVELTGLTMTGGMTSENGGGILARSAVLKMSGCVLTANTAREGGGLYAQGGTTILTDTLFEKNTALSGGGLYLQGGVMTVADSRFLSNNALSYYGGAIENASGTLTVSGSVVSKNSAANGGGIDVDRGVLSLTACVISENSALRRLNLEDHGYYGGYGGGLYNYHGEISLADCALTNNEASNWGGGVETYGNMNLVGCTLAGNRADYGGGLDVDAGSAGKVNLYNCVVAGNRAAAESDDVSVSSGAVNAYYTLSSFEDWTESESAYSYDGLIALFTDPDKGNFTLRRGTRCVNGGNNTFVTASADLAGNTRIVGGRVDLGAYEIQNAPTPLAPPEILTGSPGVSAAYGLGRQRIVWTNVDGAAGYELSYTEDGIWWTSLVVDENSHVVSGLKNGTLVQYKVRALGNGQTNETSPWSAVKSFYVSPFDIDGDGMAGAEDYAAISKAWMSMSDGENWDPRCDIDGDGLVGPGDFALFSVNWQKDSDFIFPPG
ncbi:MAG: hypothetical protein IKE69_05215 [Thermoguttaceae bacterium]|nr:hypothetical protein [Thermoguttaceae bacterium]